MNIQKDNHIFPILRIVSMVVLPFLVLAFLILYLAPQTSGERFAWEIEPAMMAAFMGAGYLTGAYFFLNLIFIKEWHRIRVVLPAIGCFTMFMLLSTIFHWSRFDIRHIPFQAWLVLYIIVPPLITWLWFRNDQVDPGTIESGDVEVPETIRSLVKWISMVLLLVSFIGFAFPNFLIQIWPWVLTPLTARVTSGWIALVGSGSVFLATEKRWSAWRLSMDVIIIWEVFILVGGFLHPQDLNPGWLNWLFIVIIIQWIALIIFYISMEMKRRKRLHAA
jgi:hypothetical protein